MQAIHLLTVLDTPSRCMVSLAMATALCCSACRRGPDRLQRRHRDNEYQCKGALPNDASLQCTSATVPADSSPADVTATAGQTAAADRVPAVKPAALIPALPPFLLLHPAPVDSKYDMELCATKWVHERAVLPLAIRSALMLQQDHACQSNQGPTAIS